MVRLISTIFTLIMELPLRSVRTYVVAQARSQALMFEGK